MLGNHLYQHLVVTLLGCFQGLQLLCSQSLSILLTTLPRFYPTINILALTIHVQYAGASPVPIPVGHLPSAQATVTVANYTQTTGVSKDSQQAKFKQGFVFKLGKDRKTQTLTIKVDDTEKSKDIQFLTEAFDC